MPEIEPEDARNVLWFFGDRANGWEPGSFTTKLLSAISAADTSNRFRLAIAFPALVAAMSMAQHDPEGLAELLKIAQGAQ